MASKRKTRLALAQYGMPGSGAGIAHESEAAADSERWRQARERDSAAAWFCMHDATRDQLCSLAGVPAASLKGHAQLTPKERTAIVIALQEPEIRKLIPDATRWGLEQLALLPEDYLMIGIR